VALPNATTIIGESAQPHGILNLYWTDNSNGEQGFRIERAFNLNFSGSSNLPLGKRDYLCRYGLTYGVFVYYRVFAFNASAIQRRLTWLVRPASTARRRRTDRWRWWCGHSLGVPFGAQLGYRAKVTYDGVVQADSQLKNDRITLDIPKNAKLVDERGNGLRSII